MNPATERVTSDIHATRTSLGTAGAVKQHWVSVAARNGSYLRAFYDEEDTLLNTRYAFGIKYRTQADYDRFRGLYLAFKASLIQFAD